MTPRLSVTQIPLIGRHQRAGNKFIRLVHVIRVEAEQIFST